MDPAHGLAVVNALMTTWVVISGININEGKSSLTISALQETDLSETQGAATVVKQGELRSLSRGHDASDQDVSLASDDAERDQLVDWIKSKVDLYQGHR